MVYLLLDGVPIARWCTDCSNCCWNFLLSYS